MKVIMFSFCSNSFKCVVMSENIVCAAIELHCVTLGGVSIT